MTSVPRRSAETRALTPEDWREVKAIFHAALERPTHDRRAFLVDACGTNVPLRQEVESLLSVAERPGNFMESPAALPVGSSAAADQDGDHLRSRLAASLDDRYVITDELARGGMSRVFLAEERALGRAVVVKALRPDLAFGVSAERFAREVRLTARLQQANIVPVLAAGDVDGLPWYTMPYVRGESLRALLTSGLPPTINESCGILRDIAKALAYAHDEGVVHRDVKPENVLLSGRTAVVTDFGIAKAVSAARAPAASGTLALNAPTDATLTRAATSVGTPAYMAPEQVAGDPVVGPEADVYAFGVLAYEVLTGVHPFADRSTTREMLLAHLADAPRPISDERPGLPAPLAALVMRCLEKNPAMRPRDGSQLVAALEDLDRGVDRSYTEWETDAPSVAVLPFANLSSQAGDDYFSDGIAEEVLTALTRMHGLRVAARTSSFSLRESSGDLRAIARRLRVGAILEGSVRRVGRRVRIGARLVSAADGLTLWSDRYDRELADIFAVQDDIAQAIARALEQTFSGGAEPGSRIARTVPQRRGVVDPAAFELYLRGRHLAEQRAEGMHEALRCFEQAIAVDPSFCAAHAGIAYAFTMFGIYHALRPHEAFPRARDAANRALDLDPTDALALAMKAQVALWYDWDLAVAETLACRALDLAPGMQVAHVGLGYVLAARGRFDEAIASMQRARQLDPLSDYATYDLSWVLVLAGRWDQAMRELRPCVGRHPQASELRRTFAFSLFYGGRLEDARAEFEEVLRLSPGDRWAIQNLVQVLAALGERDEARRLLADVQRRAEHEPIALFGVAVMHHWLGDDDAAFAWLERALEERDYWLIMLPHDPSLARLRSDPRFEPFVRRLQTSAAS